MSRKSNVNTDHYKTAGRGRQGEGLVPEIHKRAFAQARSGATVTSETIFPGARAASSPKTRPRELGLLGRPKRGGKARGLSARQLMERLIRKRQAKNRQES